MTKRETRARYYAELANGRGIRDAASIANGKPFDAPKVVTGSPDELTDDEMRDAIREATGKAPHWKASREKLVAQYEALSGG